MKRDRGEEMPGVEDGYEPAVRARDPLSKARHYRPALGAVAGILAGSIVVGLIVLIVQNYAVTSAIREDQKVNAQTGRSSASTLALIEDCLAPDGVCADAREKSNSRQAVVLTRVSVFAAACADQPTRQSAKEIEMCVKRLLDESGAAQHG